MDISTFIVRRAAIAAFAAVATLSVPAMATNMDETQSKAVSFADLDLATPAGQKVLQRRLDRAAHQLCDHETTTRDPNVRAAQSRCIADAMDGAQVQVAALTQRAPAAPRVALMFQTVAHGVPHR